MTSPNSPRRVRDSPVCGLQRPGSTAFNQTLSALTRPVRRLPTLRLPELWIQCELYAVDSSTALFVELDSNQVGIGTIQLQAATTGAAKASRVVVPLGQCFRARQATNRRAMRMQRTCSTIRLVQKLRGAT